MSKIETPSKVVIVGLPKTGTTILYSKLKKSGVLSEHASFFEPHNQKLRRNSLFKKIEKKSRVLVKDLFRNDFDSSRYNDFDKKILIVRDPRDRMISRFLFGIGNRRGMRKYRIWKNTKKVYQILQKKSSSPSTYSFLNFTQDIYRFIEPRFVSLESDTYKGIGLTIDYSYAQFIAEHSDWFVIKYEDIVDENFSKLESYLGFSVQQSAEVSVPLQRVVRSKGYNNWKHWFTPQDVDYLHEKIDPLLVQHGYSPDWNLASKQEISSDQCEGYIIRLWRTWTFKYDFLWKIINRNL